MKITATSFTARNSENKPQSHTSHKSKPMVKVPYSALMGLLMLASTTIGTTGCCNDDDDDNNDEDILKPDIGQTDTIVTSASIQKELSDMVAVLGITPITQKSLSSATGDIIEYHYRNIWASEDIIGTINLEESDENTVVYDEAATNFASGQKLAYKQIFKKTDEGLTQESRIKPPGYDHYYTEASYDQIRIEGNKVVKHCLDNDRNYNLEPGTTPNSVTSLSKTDNITDIVVFKK